ncbi:beta strand repeat-containing protein, partial [Paraburkholderia guartelaensis]|uniref:beta strand repeat-containing protein n=1 Tax=Paraburkholderia guartelaensis TaxID=2546446 RepID=UPI0019811601
MVLNASGITYTNSGRIAGGAGGNGGNSASVAGGGGDGGYGIDSTSVGNTIINTSNGSISGGYGGNNGFGGANCCQSDTPTGGAGIAGNGLTIINSGSTTGGNGGTNGGSSNDGFGSGGVGITGANLAITNSGSITGGLAGNGTTQASAITFTGGTNSLEIDAGSIITGNVVAFSSADTLILGGSINATFNMALIGPPAQYQGFGLYQKTGSSTWTLTGSTSTTTPWTISAGTLQLGDGITNGSITGNVNDNAALAFNPATGSTTTYSGVISGSGTVSQIGPGTTILTGTNTYTGGTTISAGMLQLGDGTTNGSITGNVNDNATLAFNPATGTTTTYAGVASGTGSVSQIGPGTTILTGANTYTGGTTISAGTLQLGSRGTSGSIVGGVTDNGTLAFDTGGALILSGVISGSGGVSQTGSGTTVLTGANTYTGGTTISAGRLQLGSGGTTGSIVGNVTDNRTFVFDRSDTINFGGVISGSGAVQQSGTGTAILTGANTYSGGTALNTGTIVAGNNSALGTGPLAMAAGTTLSWLRGNNYTVGNNITLTGDPNFTPPAGTTQTLTGVISDGSSPGVFNAVGPGTLVLTGTNSYTGGTNVNGGSLYINGDQTAARGATPVAIGATLGGTGIIGGSVSVNGGTLAPGAAAGGIGTLTINGNLGLTSSSNLDYSFGQSTVPGVPLNDLTVVKGNLTLDGALNVAQSPGTTFGPGVYQVFTYGGALTNNGLTLGTLPAGTTAVVQLSVPGQVNLVNTTGVTVTYWDGTGNRSSGTIDGGSGTWQAPVGNDNWTNAIGTLNAPWTNGSFAIFYPAPGTVTVDNSLGQVSASGMQFASGGYVINGGPLTLVETTAGSGVTTIRVGDGASDGAGYTATIDAVLQGSTQLQKTDLGTLVLTGANTYTGGTAINGGTLQVSADNNLGAAAGNLSFDGGTLAVTGSGFTSARSTTLNAGGGTFDIAPSGTLTMNGVISGVGALAKTDSGTLVLAGANTYTGGTTISEGTLQLGNGGTSGSIVGNVANDGTLAFDRSDTLTYGGVVSGTGALVQMGTGTTVLNAISTYSGPTTVQAGTLTVNGSISSPVTVASAGTLAGSGTVIGNVVNQGVVWPGNPVAGDTGYGALTIRGNYSDPQGQVVFNTFLGIDGSPSSRLVLDGGTTSGTSAVVVHSTGSSGVKTQNNGILLVQAVNGGTTAARAFVLNGELRSGDLDYRLFRGSVDSSAPQDWFLRSDFIVPPTPVTPTPAELPPGKYPIIGPEIATYAVVQPIARQLGLTTLGTLHERIGDTLTNAQGGAGDAGWTRSGWVRLFGQQIDNRYQTFTNASASGHLLGFQAGLDVWRGSFLPGHHDATGVYFAYGNSDVDVNGLVTNAA